MSNYLQDRKSTLKDKINNLKIEVRTYEKEVNAIDRMLKQWGKDIDSKDE